MGDKLGLYDYLSFIIPGAVIIASVVYGFELAGPASEPSAEGIVLLTAAAFVVGHLNVALANGIAPLAFLKPPFTRLSSTEGLFGPRGRYSSEEQGKIKDEFAVYFPTASTFDQQFNVGYTLLRQKELDTAIQTANQQIGLYRNMMSATIVSLFAVIFATFSNHDTLRPEIWIPLAILAFILFALRFRRFWIRFGDEVIRGIRALASSLSTQPSDEGEQ